MQGLCRDCGIELGMIKKSRKKGYANQCDDCAELEPETLRYLGFNDGSLNKSTNISIYRGNDDAIRENIQNQRASCKI